MKEVKRSSLSVLRIFPYGAVTSSLICIFCYRNKVVKSNFLTRPKITFTIRKLFLVLLLILSSFVKFEAFAQGNLKPINHKVVLGENLFRISLQFNVELDKLREWNKLKSDAIAEGQTLIVGYQSEQSLNTSVESKPYVILDYDTLLNGIVDQVEALYYESLALEGEKSQRNDTALINALFRRKYSENYLFELQNELNLAQMQAINDDIGLGFYSSFTHNFRPGVFDGEDLLFQNRANVGLDWQLLSGGLIGRKTEIEKLQIDNQINDLLKVK